MVTLLSTPGEFMTTQDDLATVTRLLVSEESIPVQLRMGEGLDEAAYTELAGAIERLVEAYRGRADVPKALALAFVDVGSSFFFGEGTYTEPERERIEDVGQELSYLASQLFGDD